MVDHTHEEHIVGKSGDYTAKGNIGDTWEKSAYTGGVSVKGSATLVDDTPDGSYDVKIKTNCDGYNHTYTVDKGENFDFKKVTTNFFDENDIKITVTGNDGQTGTFKLVIDYSTC